MLARAIVTLLMASMPFSAMAVDVKMKLSGSSQFDTNSSRSDGNTVGDFSFRMSPSVEAQGRLDQFSYRTQYAPTYKKYLDQTELDALSQFAGLGHFDHLADFQFGDIRTPRKEYQQ